MKRLIVGLTLSILGSSLAGGTAVAAQSETFTINKSQAQHVAVLTAPQLGAKRLHPGC
jgi:hypothetical protein